MAVLLLETATERGVVALFNEKRELLFESHLPFGLQQSKALMPEIERGFKELGLQPSVLEGIGVGVGPGSYTGIRMGVAVAQALAFASHRRLLGICSLQAFVPAHYEGPFTAIFDAKVGGAYLLRGEMVGQEAIYVHQPEVCELGFLKDHPQMTPYLVTPYASSLQKKLQKIDLQLDVEWEEVAPSPLHLIKLYDKIKIEEDKPLNLMYLRKTEAEREKERRESF